MLIAAPNKRLRRGTHGPAASLCPSAALGVPRAGVAPGERSGARRMGSAVCYIFIKL